MISLSAIASEKAGILKPGVPCIVAAQDPDAFAVIEAKAKTVGAPLRVFGRDFDVTERKGGFTFRANGRSIELPLPVLKGRHQIINAATAIATTGVIFGGELTDAACVQGMTEVKWPARLRAIRRRLFLCIRPRRYRNLAGWRSQQIRRRGHCKGRRRIQFRRCASISFCLGHDGNKRCARLHPSI